MPKSLPMQKREKKVLDSIPQSIQVCLRFSKSSWSSLVVVMLNRKKGQGAFFVLSGKPGNSFESISPFLVSNCQFVIGSLFGKMDLRFMEEALSGGNISKLQISYSSILKIGKIK